VLDVADAEALISSRVQALGTRSIALADACGTVLRETIFAERDQPPFDRVTMDGIAIAYRDWRAGVREFEVLATQAAGAPPSTLTGVKQCVEIMTGAMLPAGADTVIPVERITRRNDRVLVDADYKATDRQFVHPRGSDRRGGSVLLKPGIVLGPPEIAIIAGAGRAELLIAKAVRVAVISTGDELVEPCQPVLPHQIRSSNDRAITAALERHCKAAVTRASLKDEREQMLARIRKLHDEHDALILSGGVSMGKFDFVPSVLEQLGVEHVFHKIEQRPGRPMWFGISRDGKPVFALPGNPVSTLVCLYRYVLPALRKALGENAADK
jgi:molybdopterin molybdotransferase